MLSSTSTGFIAALSFRDDDDAVNRFLESFLRIFSYRYFWQSNIIFSAEFLERAPSRFAKVLAAAVLIRPGLARINDFLRFLKRVSHDLSDSDD
jgi:hypothetical protein